MGSLWRENGLIFAKHRFKPLLKRADLPETFRFHDQAAKAMEEALS